METDRQTDGHDEGKAGDTLSSRHVSSCHVSSPHEMCATQKWEACWHVRSFCCRTHFVIRDDVTVSSALQKLSVSFLRKNILFMSAATMKRIRLERYLPRLPGATSSHQITWH